MEFAQLFKTRLRNTSAEYAGAVFDAFDSDSSGTVSFKELTIALSLLCHGSVDDQLRLLFEVYDDNDSGTLERAEVEKIIRHMKKMSAAMGMDSDNMEPFIVAIFKKLDLDKDGVITLAEWLSAGKTVPSLTKMSVLSTSTTAASSAAAPAARK